MDLLLSRLLYPVTVLGPGRRAGIWFQGCAIRCPGCMSQDTWGRPATASTTVQAVLNWLRELPADQVDGVTLTGGEPTEQPEALAGLCAGIAEWRAGRDPGLPPADVLMFTGREPVWAQEQLRLDPDRWAGIDAVMAGPYQAALAGSSPLRGSENQQLLILTELGALRYGDLEPQSRQQIQLQVEPDGVWLVGIPLPGDLAALRSTMRANGLALHRTSWR